MTMMMMMMMLMMMMMMMVMVMVMRRRGRRRAMTTMTMQVQLEVARLLKGKLLVGHAVHHDLRALMLEHPASKQRDTSLYPPLRSKDGRPRSLKHLAADLGLSAQPPAPSPHVHGLPRLPPPSTGAAVPLSCVMTIWVVAVGGAW
jgi:hypothetical protein